LLPNGRHQFFSNSLEFFTPAKKFAGLLSAAADAAGIRFTHDSGCRPFGAKCKQAFAGADEPIGKHS
jgi:hypothetical protein